VNLIEYGYFHFAFADMSNGIVHEFWIYILKGTWV
jgi:hypothetical protein